MGERSPVLDQYVLELTGRRVPKICFLPTASGDEREQVRRFNERFRDWPCEPTTLSLFHLRQERIDPAGHLLAQDAIYIGGGSMRNMLAIWREHGVDEVLRAAWQVGVVLAGLSAGAMCWFEGGISLSGGRAEPVRGLGLVPGSLSVHRDSEPERLPAYRAAVAAGVLPDGHAADDGAALVYAGSQLLECVSSRERAVISRVNRANGGVLETPMPIRCLGPAGEQTSAGHETMADRIAVAELRELRDLRAGRNRWR
jgi:peptidase E